MPAHDIQLYRRDAELLYLRGVQYARDGQRAEAAVSLRQAISLNPLHEQAWLRLSDTLDDPHEIAFCLQIVLQINPHNVQAERGMAWLQHHMHANRNFFSSRLLAAPAAGAPDAWWHAWHKAQRAWIWSLRTLLLIPILLLGSTLGVHAMLANQPLPVFESQASTLATSASPVTVHATDPATVLSYFATLNTEREALTTATHTYQTLTGASQIAQQRIDATSRLLEQIRQSHTRLAALPVPVALATAHQQYLEGLALEHDALQQMLRVNQEYHPQQARQALDLLQQARTHMALATSQWDLYAQNHTVSGTQIDAR